MTKGRVIKNNPYDDDELNQRAEKPKIQSSNDDDNKQPEFKTLEIGDIEDILMHRKLGYVKNKDFFVMYQPDHEMIFSF